VKQVIDARLSERLPVRYLVLFILFGAALVTPSIANWIDDSLHLGVSPLYVSFYFPLLEAVSRWPLLLATSFFLYYPYQSTPVRVLFLLSIFVGVTYGVLDSAFIASSIVLTYVALTVRWTGAIRHLIDLLLVLEFVFRSVVVYSLNDFLHSDFSNAELFISAFLVVAFRWVLSLLTNIVVTKAPCTTADE